MVGWKTDAPSWRSRRIARQKALRRSSREGSSSAAAPVFPLTLTLSAVRKTVTIGSNKDLLEAPEAALAINTARTILHYLDAKLSV